MDLMTLAAKLGHARIQMVLRYAHPTEQHHATATRRMNLSKSTLSRYRIRYSDDSFTRTALCK